MDLGEKMLEKARRADTDPKGFSYFGHLSCPTRTGFVFVASRVQDRAARAAVLSCLCEALFVLHQPKRVVGIATNNLSADTASEDFLVLEDLDFDPVDRDEILEEARRLFADPEERITDEWGNRY